jgi:hypothetical protein
VAFFDARRLSVQGYRLLLNGSNARIGTGQMTIDMLAEDAKCGEVLNRRRAD